MKKLLFIFLFFSCTNTETILVPGEEVIKDSEALKQLFNTSYSDEILSAAIRGDTVFSFVTRRVFSYDGDEVIEVSAVRGVSVWHTGEGKNVLIGESRGYVAGSRSNSEAATSLMPGQSYAYVVVWDGGAFLATNAFYTNFYAGNEPVNLSRGVSVKKAIELWIIQNESH